MLAVFDHLRDGSLRAFRNIEHAVADDKDILLAFSPQIGIGDQAAAATLLEGGGIFIDLGAFGAGGPDDGPGFIANDLVILLVDDIAIADFIDASLEDDLDAHLFETALGFGRQFGGQGRHDAVEHVDLDDADLVALDFELFGQGVAPFGQLTGHFHAGKAGTGDEEGQQTLLFDRIGLIHGLFKDLGGMGPEAHGIVIGP